jgi:hypothetical protein
MEVPKLDVWGNPMNLTTEEVSKLQKEIIEEGMHKRSYSSAEDSDTDSEQEIIKMFSKKNHKKEKFDYIGYSFTITNKLSKMRSELARSEERLRYIQLDYNNNQIKLKEISGKCTLLSQENKKLSLVIKENELLIKKQSKQLNNSTYIMVVCFFLNSISIILLF